MNADLLKRVHARTNVTQSTGCKPVLIDLEIGQQFSIKSIMFIQQ